MLYSKVAKIQEELVAAKGQTNSFGGYKYRSCEDIIEAVKPLLDGLILTISDEMIQLGDRYYVKATATISDGKNQVQTTAFAREPETKKGMDLAQLTGATSSYARKYALNGLLAIDDTKDADTLNNSQESSKPKTTKIAAKSQRLSSALLKSVETISTAISLGDYSIGQECWNELTIEEKGTVWLAQECWNELTIEEKGTVWLAPAKGGHFTTAERKIMQSSDFKEGKIL